MEAISSSEMWVESYRTKRQYVPEHLAIILAARTLNPKFVYINMDIRKVEFRLINWKEIILYYYRNNE
jgi:hypothetical protein